jgi:hypothetical protein
MVVAGNRTWMIVDTGTPDAKSVATVFDKANAYDLVALMNDVTAEDLGPSWSLDPEPFA